MLDSITPLILTRNEAANIGRTLEQLRWAREVIVVDSCSTDSTASICSGFPNVRLFRREFDEHAAQWSFGLQQVRTDWFLALDADYFVPPEFTEELRRLEVTDAVSGGRAPFAYAIDGRRLRASLYPPRVVLARTARSRFRQDGHTQRLDVDGQVIDLHTPIVHDDRKPFAEFVRRQKRYASLEAPKIVGGGIGSVGMAGRVRRMIVLAPVAAPLYVLFARGVILDGWAGLRYAFERMVAEVILAREILRLRRAHTR